MSVDKRRKFDWYAKYTILKGYHVDKVKMGAPVPSWSVSYIDDNKVAGPYPSKASAQKVVDLALGPIAKVEHGSTGRRIVAVVRGMLRGGKAEKIKK